MCFEDMAPNTAESVAGCVACANVLQLVPPVRFLQDTQFIEIKWHWCYQ